MKFISKTNIFVKQSDSSNVRKFIHLFFNQFLAVKVKGIFEKFVFHCDEEEILERKPSAGGSTALNSEVSRWKAVQVGSKLVKTPISAHWIRFLYLNIKRLFMLLQRVIGDILSIFKQTQHFFSCFHLFTFLKWSKQSLNQGTNARKVISEVYAFCVLQWTVFGRKSKHKTDVTSYHEIHFQKKNLWNILVIWNYYVNY